MDKQQRASNLVKLLYEYRANKTNNESGLIKAVCEYFDDIKSTELTNGDRFFLRYMASVVGIPQYFDMLNHYNRIGDFNDYGNIDDLGRIIADSALYTAPEIYLHRYQKSILDMFQKNRQNRFFLSATTSFGKTYLVYEIIRKMEYNNILLIFPTLALLSENINKIFTEKYAWIRNQYKIHTLSDASSWSDHGNLMIYTPERYLSFLDKNPDKYFDFVFIDEAYKIDNEYLQEGEEKENERDVAYRIASFFAMKEVDIDCLFAGPYLNIDNSENSSSFLLFLHEYGITPLNYNDYEIVSKIEVSIGQKKSLKTDGLNITFKSTKKGERFRELVQQLCNYGENMIAYCYSRSSVEKYAYELIGSIEAEKDVQQQYMPLLKHLDNLFGGRGKEWIVTKAIKAGIGVHHGLVPKYIQNEIIKLFNEGILKIIIATTTITEGVNTSAKNIIVLSHKKGSKLLKKFDAQNIEGRAGRFLKHYRGRVFIIDNEFNRILQGDDNSIKHKHFDKEIEKGAIEVDFVKNQFLNAEDVRQKERNTAIREGIQIPEQLDLCYKTISIEDKYFLYSRIERLSQNYLSCIEQFIYQYNSRRRCNTEGLQLICDIIRPIIKNNDLEFLIDNKSNDANVSTLVRLIPLYLRNNFSASVHYYITERGNNVDDAVQKVAQTSYNTMRYQVVKYLGLFNVAYKCYIARRNNVSFDDVSGIDLILHKLEYQSETILGRLASDAGASPNVINYYDQRGKDYNQAAVLYGRLDDYEKQNAEAIRHIVERDFD